MKITLSLAALLLTTTTTFAGGGLTDVIEAVEPIADIPVLEVQKDYYVGVGYSCAQLTGDNPDQEFMAMTAVSLNAGYQINDSLAVEARYTRSLGNINYKTWNVDEDVSSSSLSNLGVYLKPQYSFETMSVYGLLGYGQTWLDNGQDTFSENGLQYGLGVNFLVMDTNIFVDYRRLYDDEGFDGLSTWENDVAANSYTLGVNYFF